MDTIQRQPYETLQLEIDDRGIITCRFNRPEARNALNLQMVRELRKMLDDLADHEDLPALIFTGSGDRSFLSGADIVELRDRTCRDALRRINTGLFRTIEQFPAPTIAAINGWCLGGGCELAMACDIRVAGRTRARMGQPEVALGIIPGAGGTYRLPRLVGIGMAKEMIFTGCVVDAERALQIGLVNRVVDDATLLASARQIAHEIADNSLLAVRFAKQALNLSHELSTDAAMALEATTQAVLFDDEGKLDRMTRFIERKMKGS